jgi:CobQ-like glutamine amidotransferase family enzyme
VSTLRVLSLYPELMNIYADRGNIAVLRARCEWRGFGFEHLGATVGDTLDPDAADLFYMGGGQDRDQAAVAVDMAETKRDALHAAADRGAVILGVCGGYQLLGESYEMDDRTLPGVGLVDLRTVREPGDRLIGNCAIEADLGTGPRVIAGFENHGGRTYLGPGAEPLGRVLNGFGNNGKDGFEGVRRGNVIGTYLHGPLLPKNVWLADRLIELALGVELEPLPGDEMEDAAHASARRAAGV